MAGNDHLGRAPSYPAHRFARAPRSLVPARLRPARLRPRRDAVLCARLERRRPRLRRRRIGEGRQRLRHGDAERRNAGPNRWTGSPGMGVRVFDGRLLPNVQRLGQLEQCDPSNRLAHRRASSTGRGPASRPTSLRRSRPLRSRRSRVHRAGAHRCRYPAHRRARPDRGPARLDRPIRRIERHA